ncbi:hypothetical protein HDU85_003206 [Gaertneriomyces sp. JEL0708]|nr:hypothetical protein HDU85_003206 [Gaertneriomyces sp. JEL0708]
MAKPGIASDALARTDRHFYDDAVTYQLHPSSKADPSLKKLTQSLVSWINSYVARESMIVRDLVMDLDDGQILATFIEKLTGDRILAGDLLAAKSDRSKAAILHHVARYIEHNLKINVGDRWSPEGIMGRDISSVLCLLVDLAEVFACPYPLPPNVSIAVQKREDLPSGVKNKTTVHKITFAKAPEPAASKRTSMMSHTSTFTNISSTPTINNEGDQPKLDYDPDAFDKLFENPDNVTEMTKLLLEFANSQLENLGIRLNSLSKIEGTYLILLIGTLANFFVPLNCYQLNPSSMREKIDNARFALSMMTDLEVDTSRIHESDLVRKDAKTIARCLYVLFQKFRESAKELPVQSST